MKYQEDSKRVLNDNLYNLYASEITIMLSKLKKTMWMGGVSTMYGETEKCIQNLA
jgi:hypothetical protein